MAEETSVIGVRFPVDRITEIEERAAEQGKSKSEFIRDAVARELGEELLQDRVELLEEAVAFLLEQSAPGEEIEYVNSPHLNYLNQLSEDYLGDCDPSRNP